MVRTLAERKPRAQKEGSERAKFRHPCLDDSSCHKNGEYSTNDFFPSGEPGGDGLFHGFGAKIAGSKGRFAS